MRDPSFDQDQAVINASLTRRILILPRVSPLAPIRQRSSHDVSINSRDALFGIVTAGCGLVRHHIRRGKQNRCQHGRSAKSSVDTLGPIMFSVVVRNELSHSRRPIHRRCIKIDSGSESNPIHPEKRSAVYGLVVQIKSRDHVGM